KTSRSVRPARPSASPAMVSAFCGDLGLLAHVRPLQLAQLAQDDVPPERGQMIDEQYAVEMIDLVLDAGREQTLCLELADLVVVVEIAHADRARPRHLSIVLGHREAALFSGHQVVRYPEQLR